MWEKMKDALRLAYEIMRAAIDRFGRDRADRMAAAVAYRTMFALAPLLLVGIWVLGLVLGGNEPARQRILDEVARVGGTEMRQAFDDFLANAIVSGDTAALLGFALLTWTGSSLFLELQRDLNDIFGVPLEERSGFTAMLLKRGLGFLWVIVFGVALIAFWGLNAVWQFIGDLVPEMLDELGAIFALLAPLVSLIIVPLVLALAYQTLSHLQVRWRAIWWGSFVTSAILIGAAYLVGLYFRMTTEPNAVNVAGSIFVILLLAFVLSAVFFFGAELIEVIEDYLEKGSARQTTEREAGDVEREAQPVKPASLGAVVAFLTGLFLGRRSRRP
ncbi:MAG: YihY/virulence factor BrkB family protein [Acidimicrobiia bacterium]